MPVALLPRRIPNLELQAGAVHCYGLYFEIYSDCGHVAVLVRVLAEPHKDVGLADRGIADYDHFQ